MNIKDMKTEKMRRLVAGHYVPTGHAESMLEEIDSRNVSDEFRDGAVCMLGFLTCEKEADLHGASFAEFLDNFFEVISDDGIPDAVMSVAQKVIEDLQGMGIKVVRADVIEVKQ